MRAGRRLHDLPVTPRTPRLVTGGFIDLGVTMKGKYHIDRVVALMAWPFNDISIEYC